MAYNKAKFETVLTKEDIPEDLHNRVVMKLTVARTRLLLVNPFFGYLIIRMPMVAADGWVPTAATDGKHFYYNHAFVDALNDEEVEFLVGHEMLHCVYEHGLRISGRNHGLWNSAADYAINLDLVDFKIGRLINTVTVLYDTKYRKMSAEDIYDDLFEDFKDQIQKMEGDKGDGSKGSGSGNAELDDILKGAIDEILDGSSDEGKETDATGKNGPIPMSDEDRAALRDEIREAVINAANNVGADSIPLGIRRMISSLTEPKMNWRELLRAQIESSVVSDYSWLRTSRIGWDIDAVMPGMDTEKSINICVALDTSGSISENMIRDFLSEVSGIMSQFGQYQINLWTFDGKVHNPQTFTSENLEDLANYDIQGGGGTLFEVNFAHMKENELVPDKFIMFTDGYPCDTWGDPNYVDTIFVIHGNDSIVPPFGMHAYYGSSKE